MSKEKGVSVQGGELGSSHAFQGVRASADTCVLSTAAAWEEAFEPKW